MGVRLDYLREHTQRATEIGSDESLTPREALSSLLQEYKAEFDSSLDLVDAKKLRKAAVAQRLNQLRRDSSMSQKEVAQQVGLNVVTLSGYEIGKSEPPEEVLVRLACLYGVSLDYLMCRTDTKIVFDGERYEAIDHDRQQVKERLSALEKELSALKNEVK